MTVPFSDQTTTNIPSWATTSTSAKEEFSSVVYCCEDQSTPLNKMISSQESTRENQYREKGEEITPKKEKKKGGYNKFREERFAVSIVTVGTTIYFPREATE